MCVCVYVCVKVSERSEIKQHRWWDQLSNDRRRKNEYTHVIFFFKTIFSIGIDVVAANLNVSNSPPLTIISSLNIFFLLRCKFDMEIYSIAWNVSRMNGTNGSKSATENLSIGSGKNIRCEILKMTYHQRISMLMLLFRPRNNRSKLVITFQCYFFFKKKTIHLWEHAID